uniref:Uncharacterized protein n=1 Tax=Zea mays TaxID=4577 RepID=B6SQT2_MAIZE|nr:hypothetical protein [Zea mays]
MVGWASPDQQVGVFRRGVVCLASATPTAESTAGPPAVLSLRRLVAWNQRQFSGS